MGQFGWKSSVMAGGLSLGLVMPATAGDTAAMQVRLGDGSAEQTTVTVPSWKDGLSELIESRRPTGEVRIGTLDRSTITAMRWSVEPPDSAGWIVVTGPPTVGIEDYPFELRYRETAEGIELVATNADEFGSETSGTAVGIAQSVPGEGAEVGTLSATPLLVGHLVAQALGTAGDVANEVRSEAWATKRVDAPIARVGDAGAASRMPTPLTSIVVPPLERTTHTGADLSRGLRMTVDSPGPIDALTRSERPAHDLLPTSSIRSTPRSLPFTEPFGSRTRVPTLTDPSDSPVKLGYDDSRVERPTDDQKPGVGAWQHTPRGTRSERVAQGPEKCRIASDTPDALVISRTLAAAPETLSIYRLLPATNEAARAIVMYENGTSSILAEVIVDGDFIHVSGSIDGTRYAHETALLPDGTVRTEFANGARFVAVGYPAHGTLGRPQREALQDYALAIPIVQFELANRLKALLVDSEDLPFENAALFNIASVALAATGLADAPFRPTAGGGIAELQECMQNACTDAGGCYDQQSWWECRECEGVPWWQNRVGGFVYLAEALRCISRWVNPILE